MEFNKIKSIITFLIMLPLHNNFAFYYSPVIKFELKGANRRNIARVGFLTPIIDNRNTIFYTSLFAMKDNKKASEGNFGIGVRHLIKDKSILGLYSYWDLRHSQFTSNNIHQFTLGAELFFKHLEFRVNGYIPILNQKVETTFNNITSNYFSSANQTIEIESTKSTYSVALNGFDIDIGGSMPHLPPLRLYGAYYHFFRDNISLNGYRLRANYFFNKWLYIGGESNYDNKRKWYNYIEIGIRYKFNKNKHKLTSISEKMNLLPIRDIDVIEINNNTPIEVKPPKTRIYIGKRFYFIPQNKVNNKTYSGNNIYILTNSDIAKKVDEAWASAVEVSDIIILDNIGRLSTILNTTAANKVLSYITNEKGVLIISDKISNNHPLNQYIQSFNKKYIKVQAINKYYKRKINGKLLIREGFNIPLCRKLYQEDDLGLISKNKMDNWRARHPNDRIPDYYFDRLTHRPIFDAVYDRDSPDIDLESYTEQGLRQKLSNAGIPEEQINARIAINRGLRSLIEQSFENNGPQLAVLRGGISLENYCSNHDDLDNTPVIILANGRTYTRSGIEGWFGVQAANRGAQINYIDPISREILSPNIVDFPTPPLKANKTMVNIISNGIY